MTATADTVQRALLIERFTAAWEDADVDALMELMADDPVFRASVGPEPGASFEGRDEVRRGFELFLAAARAGAAATAPGNGSASAAETVTDAPLICADFAVTRWTTRQSQPSGPPVAAIACDVFVFEGDRIKLKDTYRKVTGRLPDPE